MDKTYKPSKTEKEIYSYWLSGNLFAPSDQNTELDPFTIIMPPPNVTGELHMGHALTLAIEDFLLPTEFSITLDADIYIISPLFLVIELYEDDYHFYILSNVLLIYLIVYYEATCL